ncbi:MAG: hypothetical protein HY744_34085 [Deltaproteobacteria bacterium]|nr:hypothetical protein [Deltaproteobacteria bacterium]
MPRLAGALGLALLLRTGPAVADEMTSGGQGAASPSAACGSTLAMAVEELAAAAKAHARQGQWVCARLFFGRAYARQRSFDLAGNLGIVTHELALAERDDRLFAEAATLLAEALRGFPVAGPAEQRATLAERLDDVRGRVVTLSVKLEPAASCLTVAGRDAGCGPHPFELFAAPGRVDIEARAAGYRAQSAAVARAVTGSRHVVRIALEPHRAAAVAGEAAIADEPAGFPAWPALVAGGAALGAVAVGAGLWVAGDDAEADAVELGDARAAQAGNHSFCLPPIEDAELQADCDEIAAGLGRRDDYHNTAGGLFVGAGVLAASAGIFAVLHLRDGDEEGGAPGAAVSIGPAASPLGRAIGLSLRGRW